MQREPATAMFTFLEGEPSFVCVAMQSMLINPKRSSPSDCGMLGANTNLHVTLADKEWSAERKLQCSFCALIDVVNRRLKQCSRMRSVIEEHSSGLATVAMQQCIETLVFDKL